MDFSTIVGLMVCVTVCLGAILTKTTIGTFIDPASALITVFGAAASVAICYPPETLMGVPKIFSKAIKYEPRDPKALLSMLQDMSNRARREGTLSLEEFLDTIDDEFFARGIQLVVDGHEPQAVEDVLYMEMKKIDERHKLGIDIFETLEALAPAFGMIGTLIGLVIMLKDMSDPTKIGPAMAVALLTTLYGSIIANIFAKPISKKLEFRSVEEIQEKEIIAQGILSILNRESPRFLVERLNIQLAPDKRVEAG
jgi:chemotaxis protein MotA